MAQLIIYAHPLKEESHCGEILKAVKAKLPNADLIDLYEDQFNPVYTKDERLEMQSPSVSNEIESYQKRIAAADDIIIIYPIWWNSTPAILKGFFDRVLTYDFAFAYQKNGMPQPLLKGKNGYVIATSGAPDLFRKLLMKDMAQKVVVKNVLGYCGIKGKALAIGGASKLNDSMVSNINNKVSSFLKSVN